MRIFICPCVEKEKSMAAMPSVTAVLAKYGIEPVMSDALRSVYDDERVTYREASPQNSNLLNWCQNANREGPRVVKTNPRHQLQNEAVEGHVRTKQSNSGTLSVTPKNTIFLSSVTGLAEVYV